VTTNGTPNVVGTQVGFVTLFTKYVGRPLARLSLFMNEVALCAKAGLKELVEVMTIETKVINYISVRALKKRISEFAKRGEFGEQRTTYVQLCSLA
jgi:hypothetical protein